MPVLIKKISNSIIEFDNSSFDQWCVYLTRPGSQRYAPKDIEYFSRLQQLGIIYGPAKIFNDFIRFYSSTGKNLDEKIVSFISVISENYGDDAEEIDIWFTIIYAGMIAEENKNNAILKKRVKRLGMQQVLLEGRSAEYAANFSKGKKWQELDEIMKKKGF